MKPNRGGETDEERLAFQRTPSLAGESVRVSWADGAGTHSAIVSERVTIGSASGANIVVSDPTVSRLHAELEPREDGLWIRDLGSKNGTWVRGVFVVEARLASERQVRLGSITFDVSPEAGVSARPVSQRESFGQLVGRAVAMRRLFAALTRVAATEYSVLVRGETGTGKELVARAIHDESRRQAQPFVVVDCAAIPEALFESQLFGHARGSFTGALTARVGDFEAAQGGTIFLDEVGELPASIQPKLLRVLESRAIRRVGETQTRAVDVRIVSATHRDLLAMVSAGTFREDLYFRLAAVPIMIPPLRDRLEDVPLLVQRFLPPDRGGLLSAELAADLAERRWAGNVRELRNFVERAVALGVPFALEHADGGPAAGAAQTPSAAPPHPTAGSLPANPFATISLDQLYRDFREQWVDHGERVYLERMLEVHGGNVAGAAEHAGLDRTHVYRLLRKHR